LKKKRNFLVRRGKVKGPAIEKGPKTRRHRASEDLIGRPMKPAIGGGMEGKKKKIGHG